MNKKDQLVIGARGSKLSVWQANHIKERLCIAHPGLSVTISTFLTAGDRFLDTPLAKIGGKGLFTKEIETAILEGKVDLAVHSLKDMPAELPAGLTIAAVTDRVDSEDAFVSNSYLSLDELPQGAVLGTSSLRRKAQILAIRPDLQIENVRGNVDTRLRKLDSGEYDAIVLAVAGLKRLGLGDRITQVLQHDICLPAVGQGALAVETRSADEAVIQIVSCLEHHATRLAVTAERAYLRVLEGNCQVPVGVYGQVVEEQLELRAVILSLDGRQQLSDDIRGNKQDALDLGQLLAKRMLAAGGNRLLEDLALGEEGNRP